MKLAVPLLCLAALALAGCGDLRGRVEKQLATVDHAQLRRDAARLYKDIYVSRGPDYVPLAVNLWPASFTALRPAQVSAYPDGIALVMQSGADAETGLLIVPESITREPNETRRADFEPLAEGFYWYRFARDQQP